MTNKFTWYDKNVIASIKAGSIPQGQRLLAVDTWWKAMHAVGKDEDMWKEQDLVSMEDVCIWGPALGDLGQAFIPKQEAGIPVVYLSPMLEFESLPEVVHTVAHEFAHIFLKHHRGEGSVAEAKAAHEAGKSHKELPHELEADALAAKWGFPVRNKPFFLHKIIDIFCDDKKIGQRAKFWLRKQLGVRDDGTNA
jgi:hypothetical protein